MVGCGADLARTRRWCGPSGGFDAGGGRNRPRRRGTHPSGTSVLTTQSPTAEVAGSSAPGRPRTPVGLWPRTWLVMSEHAKHEAVQLVRFAGVERGEYRRGGLVQEHLGLAQHAASGRGEDQDLPPPVALVTMTGDEPGPFQVIDERDHVAAVDAQPRRDIALAFGPELGQAAQDRVLVLAQPGRGQVLAAEPADHCREPGELVGLPVSQGRGRRRLPGLGFWSHSPTVTRIGWYHH